MVEIEAKCAAIFWYEMPNVKRVAGAYRMPGGGLEMRFPYRLSTSR